MRQFWRYIKAKRKDDVGISTIVVDGKPCTDAKSNAEALNDYFKSVFMKQDSEFFPDGYHVFRRDRADGYGGVLLACRNSINCQELTFDTNSESVVCRVTLNCHQSVIICSFYRPPNKEVQNVKDLCDLFTSITTTYPNIPIWLAGDLNLSNIDWENSCTQGSAYPLALCDTVFDFLQEYGFTQVVNFPTRANNTLDVFITNRPSLLHSCSSIAGISDHEGFRTKWH